MTLEEAIKSLKKLKSFHNGSYGTAIDEAIKALEQHPCEDCISREEVISEIDRYIDKAQSTGTRDDFISFQELVVKQLPSVTPTRTKGKWIQTKDECDGVNFYDFSFECTKCGKEQSFKSNYCPNCGAYMRESGDDE
mgnify:CR=1 FL=1